MLQKSIQQNSIAFNQVESILEEEKEKELEEDLNVMLRVEEEGPLEVCRCLIANDEIVQLLCLSEIFKAN